MSLQLAVPTESNPKVITITCPESARSATNPPDATPVTAHTHIPLESYGNRDRDRAPSGCLNFVWALSGVIGPRERRTPKRKARMKIRFVFKSAIKEPQTESTGGKLCGKTLLLRCTFHNNRSCLLGIISLNGPDLYFDQKKKCSLLGKYLDIYGSFIRIYGGSSKAEEQFVRNFFGLYGNWERSRRWACLN